MGEDAAYENLPVLNKDELPLEWQGEHPVLCVAGRSLIDEAAAIMLGQLSTEHGLSARVEGAEALSTTNVFRLDTTGVAIVCLVYLDASGPAHMRYSVRRLRRKLPKATIILGCWMKDIDPAALEQLRDAAKADLIATESRRGAQTLHRGNGRRDPSLNESQRWACCDDRCVTDDKVSGDFSNVFEILQHVVTRVLQADGVVVSGE